MDPGMDNNTRNILLYNICDGPYYEAHENSINYYYLP